ncbi:MAG: NAD(P)H-dependent oxidoreductase subunit E [Planctomycetota bacterium]|nr:MAG: NAD(P)H-dependent oxidoreductase subunit E [Planctomycetota bacterium]
MEAQQIAFNEEQMQKFHEILKRYPKEHQVSAVMPVLYLAQEAFGNITPEVMVYVADLLGISPAKVKDVFTFYTYYRRPGTGKYRIDVCSTLSCALCGSKSLLDHLKKRLGIGPGETTKDGKFSIMKVECIAACGGAPAIQINGEYYENLTPEKLDKILDSLE